ncbi:hypothetical protein [Corynebacterium durum]|jgi:hypothetical protein|uniref:Uncharacterized protein n=1 Tax=Corynebacterium durum F0235 TaxID=1035195 RepID=L1MHA2_9CORY|nr:hypothetical protein [Corynebacterium durum]EKX90632.1 hypothetical protein HMPREF9997_01127 [Corynebacterium durum F0235]
MQELQFDIININNISLSEDFAMTTLRTLSVIAVAGLFLTGCSLIGGNGDSETTTAAKTTTAEVTTSTITQTATTTSSTSTSTTATTSEPAGSSGFHNSVFGKMPKQISDMTQRKLEVNNPEEEASVFYRNDTEEMRVHEFLATVDEGKREIKDSEKDEARHDFVDSYTEGKSFASTRQEVSASGMDFSCAEGNNTEEKYYEAGCFTVYRGRVMNYQRHDSTPRSLEEQKHRTASLAKEVGEALASLPN